MPCSAQVSLALFADVSKRDHRALKQIKLDLPDRQVTGMIGPSGCGKSTLLRVLNRMYDLYPGQRATGEVMMDDVNIIWRSDKVPNGPWTVRSALPAAYSGDLVQRDRRGDARVQRLVARGHRDPDEQVARARDHARQPAPLGPDDEDHRPVRDRHVPHLVPALGVKPGHEEPE